MSPLNWVEIILKNDDAENWADPIVPSSGWRRPGQGKDNDDGKGEEVTQGREIGIGDGLETRIGRRNRRRLRTGRGEAKAMEDGNGNRMGKWKGNGKGCGIVK